MGTHTRRHVLILPCLIMSNITSSGSPTKVLRSLIERVIGHILTSYRTTAVDRSGERLAITGDVGSVLEDIGQQPVSRSPSGFDEIDSGSIEMISSHIHHLIAKIATAAQRLATHRSQSSITVLDVLSAYFDYDEEGTYRLASACRTDNSKIVYLSHLNTPPFPMEIDRRIERYADRVLWTNVSRKRNHCPFPGKPPSKLPEPTTTFATIVLDVSRRFYFALCLDVIRALLSTSAVHARKFQGVLGDGANVSEVDLSEWGLEHDVETRPNNDADVPFSLETLQTMIHAISGSEEAIQNLIAQEVCGLTLHQSVSCAQFDVMYDPVDYFLVKVGFITPKMAAMIRSECYRVLILSWDLITKAVYSRLHASRLSLSLAPHAMKRLSTLNDHREVHSYVSFIPFAVRAGLSQFVHQPEPGGAVLGALANEVMQTEDPNQSDIRDDKDDDSNEFPPGLERHGLADVLSYGPSHCPLYAAPLPDLDVFGQRLLVQGSAHGANQIRTSWQRWTDQKDSGFHPYSEK
eukprot:GHVH01008476.1.p1 GENE.GHVH01008476.1~~GHVH01008476.1.p1  ORF type:complete len:520 (+),score=57.12 GHVH01008476.1:93-1652(+)